MTKILPRIAVVPSTTREGRFADRAIAWIADLAARRDLEVETVDLRDHPLPLFDEAMSPAMAAPQNPVARAWGERMASFDGYIFVTAEYNHSVPGALKNALDYLHPQLQRKPSAFVAYGGVGGARAVEHLRLILVEQQSVPLQPAVHVGLAEFRGMLMDGKDFTDYPYLAESADKMLDDLAWWTDVLRSARKDAANPAREAA